VDDPDAHLDAVAGTPGAIGTAGAALADPPRTPLRFAAVNLISDPIHGYVELTKRLAAAESRAAGLPGEDVAEDDLLDTAWVQRLRRISQLQSARWVFPTAEHSRFTHGLGVMHEAGLWARSLYPSLRASLPSLAPGERVPSEGLVVETLRVAGLLHDVGHGPFAHFFDDWFLARFPAPADPRRPGAKSLSHEDLSQLVIERELGPLIAGLRRAPGSVPERDAFADGEAIDPRWVSVLVSKPPIADASMPGWVRVLQPLLSGVFTVDNLDYVRRDAYLTGVSMGPVDAERLRRYTFVSDRGLTLFESGVGALEMFLTARMFMHRHVYLHRTVRAIDLDLADVFAPSILAVFGDGSPAARLGAFADLDEYALLHQAALWARGEHIAASPEAGDGTVTAGVADAWRAILLRRPRWRLEREVLAETPTPDWPPALLAELGSPEPGHVALDLTGVDSRPGAGLPPALAIERREGGPGPSVDEALARVPAWSLIGRRYRRVA
jgi:HD superfamily phosphohydrolase